MGSVSSLHSASDDRSCEAWNWNVGTNDVVAQEGSVSMAGVEDAPQTDPVPVPVPVPVPLLLAAVEAAVAAGEAEAEAEAEREVKRKEEVISDDTSDGTCRLVPLGFWLSLK